VEAIEKEAVIYFESVVNENWRGYARAEIAMEYGRPLRPVCNVLEDDGFRLLLVNPAQVKALAGRKSDQRHAKRIAEY
jgi:hypothetical protein